MHELQATIPDWLQLLWATTPFILSLTLLFATLRTQRTRLTLEDHDYLRRLIRYELAQMRKAEQAPYHPPAPFDPAP